MIDYFSFLIVVICSSILSFKVGFDYSQKRFSKDIKYMLEETAALKKFVSEFIENNSEKEEENLENKENKN